MSVSTQLRLDDVRRAWEARDPELRPARRPAGRPSPTPSAQTPIREGAPTFAKFLAEIRSKAFRKKPEAEQAHYRVEQLKALEAPERRGPAARPAAAARDHPARCGRTTARSPGRACWRSSPRVPLTYGPWRALKRIFKEAEARGDTEIFGALAARFDAAYAPAATTQISRDTLAYLVRRGLALPAPHGQSPAGRLRRRRRRRAGPLHRRHPLARHLGRQPHLLPRDAASTTAAASTSAARRPSLLKDRAFADLWQRSPRPLFALLERARSDQVRRVRRRGPQGRLPRRRCARSSRPGWPGWSASAARRSTSSSSGS